MITGQDLQTMWLTLDFSRLTTALMICHCVNRPRKYDNDNVTTHLLLLYSTLSKTVDLIT